MPRKLNPSLIPRFTGNLGRRNLLSAICAQQSVNGDIALARRLATAGVLKEFPTARFITHQGDADSEISFVLNGSVGVIINQREVAVRSGGTHIGEMALLDQNARRSASIVAKERTIVFQVSEINISRIARAYPDFWRRIALELASRLRERAKFIREPNSTPVVFIGCSSESLTEASYLAETLTRSGLTCKLWTQGVFQLSKTTIESLVDISKECDFAALFLTNDDMTISRGIKKATPRDNMVFELGLFMGAIGRERTFIIVPKRADIKLPTDLLGVTRAEFEGGHRGSVARRLRPVCMQLKGAIRILNAR